MRCQFLIEFVIMTQIIKELLCEQYALLNDFFNRIDSEKSEEIFHQLLQCKGVLVFSGVGKSGIISQKLAMTLLSTGTKSIYLPASNALHGDIGIVGKEDILILMSKSGETEELVRLIPFARKKGAMIISIVSNASSRLAKRSDFFIVLPMEKELCPFDLAPTISAEIQLIFGDVLAMALMRAKKFSLNDYALNHPAGIIGKKITLKVKDLMICGSDIPKCSSNDCLIDVLPELSSKKCGCLLALDDEDRLLGIFTDGDLRRSLQSQGSRVLEEKIRNLMTSSPKCTEVDVLAIEAMKQMEADPQRLVNVLCVLEKDKIVGVIRMHDIVQAGLSR